MSIYETAVKKPITTALIFVAIAVVGLFSFTRLATELMPETDTTDIMVITAYPGASAEDIESNVTKLLENSLNSVDNLKDITSKSRENTSVITLKFNAGTDIAEATNDTRDKIDAVRSTLPEGTTTPIIFKFGTSDIPIAILSVESQESSPALKKILDSEIVNPLARLEGVGSVTIAGASERVVQVYCDPMKLESYGLTLATVAQVIAADNANIPAGQIDLGTRTNSIRVQGEYADPLEMAHIVLASVAGRSIHLSDVATIKDITAERQQENYTNGQSGAIIVINKQSGGNAVAISELVREELPRLQKNLPSDVRISYLIDTSSFITNTINSLQDTILITFIVVMIIVYIFLGRSSATFIVVLTIPVSLIGTFIYLMASGNSLNIITLSSLSIAIGMVVDDAIVVLENITTHIERGSYPKQAAVHATNEVGVSVIASTLTMLAVFVPLTMIEGESGLLFRQLGWMMTIVMIVSTIAALSLTPMLGSQLLRRNSKPNPVSLKLLAPFNRFLDRLDARYERFLGWTVRHRRATIFSALGLFLGSLLLFPLIKFELMPSQDVGFMAVTVEMPVGTSTEETKAVMLDVDRRIRSEIPEVATTAMTVGTADSDNAWASMQDNGSNIALVRVGLVPLSERDRSQEEVQQSLRELLSTYPQIKSYAMLAVGGSGNQGGNSIEIDVYGHDFEQTDAVAKDIERQLRAYRLEDGKALVSEVSSSRKEYTPELRFVFDRQKLADNGLTLAGASSYLRNAINGTIASYYREDGDEYKIRVSLDPQYRRSLEDINDILVQTPQGANVRLSELGHIDESYTPPTIDRKNRSRVVTLSVSGAPGVVLSEVAEAAQSVISSTDIPSNITTYIGGTYETQQKTNQELSLLLLLVLLLVFIVMAAQFESLSLPFVIMFSVPFAFTGVFLGLVVTQIPLGSMAFIGLIMLVGIVVKNGIVLIDYTLLLRQRGYGVRQAVLKAGRSRLRPVLMTTLTTVLGMVPMAIGVGEGSEMWQSMGVTVVFGLSLSTLVTLVLIPTLYAAMEARFIVRDRAQHRKRLLRKGLVSSSSSNE